MKPLLPLLLVLLLSPALAQEQADTSLDKLLRLGIDLFDRGQYPAAGKRFEELLKKGPGPQDLLRLRRLAGVGKLVEILDRGGVFEKFARALLESTAGSATRPLVPDEKLAALAAQVVGEDAAARQRAFAELDSRGGERSVPHFLPHLRAGGAARARAIDALRRLGPQVVLPLIELLHSGEQVLVGAAAEALRGIDDRRAAADLQWIAAKQAAAPLYLRLAQGYYRERRWAVSEALDLGQFWAWRDGALRGHRIPSWLFSLFQAERAALRGLALAPGDEQLIVIAASIFYAQHARARDRLAGVLSRKSAATGRARIDAARQTLDALARPLALAHAAGPRTVYRVLGQALAESRRDVAREACRGLADLVPHGSAPGRELLDALAVPDNAVKFQAARAIVRIDPREAFAQADDCVRALEATVGQSGSRVALIIGGDAPSRNQLAYVLRTEERMEVFTAASRDEGTGLATQWPAEDVIFIDAHLGGRADGAEARSMIELIRSNPQLARIPIFGIVKQATPRVLRAMFQERVLMLPLRPKEYLPMVRRELARFAGDYKSEARAAAAEAARALAAIDPRRSVFRLALARKGLVQALRREDAVRLPALVALGRLGDPRTVGPLVRVLAAKRNPPAVRARAAWAVGRIHAGQREPDGATLRALVSGLGDRAAEVQQACAEALGRCKLDVAVRRRLLESQRLRPSEIPGAK